MIENMHDVPWLPREQLGPETTASMAAICAAVRRENPGLPMGIQVLSAGNKEAMAIAKATGTRHCLIQCINCLPLHTICYIIGLYDLLL